MTAVAATGGGAGSDLREGALRRWIERIWHIEGEVPLGDARSPDEAFDRLAPLFRHTGTTVQQRGDTLTFHKVDPAAQDPLAVFDGGVIAADTASGDGVLRYRLVSRALLFCFLAPLLFLAFSQATVLVAKYQASTAAEKKDEKKKEQIQLPQNAIDKMLGAPAPEPKKKDAKKDEDKGPKPTAAYVFAGIFAFLYVVGRILEDRLVRRAFLRRLEGEVESA